MRYFDEDKSPSRLENEKLWGEHKELRQRLKDAHEATAGPRPEGDVEAETKWSTDAGLMQPGTPQEQVEAMRSHLEGLTASTPQGEDPGVPSVSPFDEQAQKGPGRQWHVPAPAPGTISRPPDRPGGSPSQAPEGPGRQWYVPAPEAKNWWHDPNTGTPAGGVPQVKPWAKQPSRNLRTDQFSQPQQP